MTSNYEFLCEVCFKAEERIRRDKKSGGAVVPYQFTFLNETYRILPGQYDYFLCKIPYESHGILLKLNNLTPEDLLQAMDLIVVNDIHAT